MKEYKKSDLQIEHEHTTIRLFYAGYSPENRHTDYVDKQVTSWEVVGSLLILQTEHRSEFVPLSALRSFHILSPG